MNPLITWNRIYELISCYADQNVDVGELSFAVQFIRLIFEESLLTVVRFDDRSPRHDWAMEVGEDHVAGDVHSWPLNSQYYLHMLLAKISTYLGETANHVGS